MHSHYPSANIFAQLLYSKNAPCETLLSYCQHKTLPFHLKLYCQHKTVYKYLWNLMIFMELNDISL